MRDIDLIPIRLHKVEPTWEIIDELIDHIDSLCDATSEEYEEDIYESYRKGKGVGYDRGFMAGVDHGFNLGYTDGFMDGKRAAGD